jgi:hypothetical protein
MPQKPLGKAGKSLNKKVVPPSRQSAKVSKQRKGALRARAHPSLRPPSRVLRARACALTRRRAR